uniref:SexM n=1 Tax=Mucor irregularis TaxID=713888 RepID=A0A1S6Q8Q1_9FUNG|nr:sexM [Mucor irregularis]
MCTIIFEDFTSSKTDAETVHDQADLVLKRPANSYILYRQDMIKRKDIQQLGIHASELSKVISFMWRNEKQEKKKHYEGRAELNAIEHKKMHPYYNHKRHSKANAKRTKLKKRQATNERTVHQSKISSNTESSIELENKNKESTPVQLEPFSSAIPPSSVIDKMQIILDGSRLDDLTLSLYQSIDFVAISAII